MPWQRVVDPLSYLRRAMTIERPNQVWAADIRVPQQAA